MSVEFYNSHFYFVGLFCWIDIMKTVDVEYTLLCKTITRKVELFIAVSFFLNYSGLAADFSFHFANDARPFDEDKFWREDLIIDTQNIENIFC